MSADAPVPSDRSDPATPEDLFRRLDGLGIAHETVDHDPVFTVEEAKALRGKIEGGHTKNLFLRNKKGQMWLVVCLEDRLIDLRALAKRLDAGRFSFSSTDRLMKFLGVNAGAVTPFAVMNDKERLVRVVVDMKMLELEKLNFHPLDNARTTSIGAQDLVKFLVAEGHAPEITNLEAVEHRG